MFLKIMSYDIEVLPIGGRMPTADKCPILMVSCTFNFDFKVSIEEGDRVVRSICMVLSRNEGDESKFVVEKGRLMFYCNDEMVILEKLFELMKGCDVITGYNICGFDFPYVIDRWKALGGEGVKVGHGDGRLYYRKHLSKGMTVVKVGGLTGKIVFDVMYLLRREDESNIFKKEYNLKNVTLKHVAKEILGIEKLEFSVEEMISYWDNYGNTGIREKFIDYGVRDSELALMFVVRYRLLDRFIMMSRESGKLCQVVVDSLGSGALVENLLLKAYKTEDRVMPCRSKVVKEIKELGGAEVLIPKLGVIENLASVDYRSLYPSVMITHNLCYSTVVVDKEEGKRLVESGKAVEETGEMGNCYGIFVKKEVYVGIVPKILTGLLGERALLKKELKKQEKGSATYILYDAQQQAVKILLNSFYGYSGDSGAKLYFWTIATAVTTNGRKVIKKTWYIVKDEIGVVEFEGRKFKLGVSAGDTDSSYIEVISVDNGEVSRKEVVGCVNYVIEKVNSVVEKPMELAFENYVRRIVVVAKKHYAMLIEDDNGKRAVVSKGIESVRRDWCNFATENMSKIVDYVLIEKDLREGVNKSIELVKNEAKRLKKGEIDVEKLVLSNKLTKPITMYDNKEAHVLVAIKNKERGRPSEIGDRVQFLICNNGGELISEKAEDVEWALKNKIPIDYEYYLLHQLIPPTMRILGLLGVKKEQLLIGLDEKQTNLSKWFL